eukprot:g12551.t1
MQEIPIHGDVSSLGNTDSRESPNVTNQLRLKVGWLGLAMLAPWCVIIGAPDYWIDCVGSDKIGADMSLYFMLFNFSALLFCLYMSSSSQYWDNNPGVVMAGAYGVFLLPLAFVSVTTKPSYGSLVFIASCFGIGQGISQTEVFRFVAVLPKLYTGDCVAGQACAGLLFSVLRLMTKTGDKKSNGDADVGITIYFFVGLLVVAMASYISYSLPRDNTLRNFGLSSNVPGSGTTAATDFSKGTNSYEQLYDEQEAALENLEGNSGRDNQTLGIERRNLLTFQVFKSIAFEIRVMAMQVFMVFCCSLMFFPAVTSHMHSKNGAGSWFPVLNGLIFNIFDTVGRLSAQRYTIPQKYWVLCNGFRFIFFAILFPVAFYAFDDISVYLLVMLLALSNGKFSPRALPPSFRIHF